MLGGWIAVFAGDIANNLILVKLKIAMKGKLLRVRTIGSTIIGEGVNTALFYLIALYGILPDNVLIQAIMTGWLIKTLVEIIFTPITYLVVPYLKKAENSDHYEDITNFNPLIFKAPF